MNCSCLETFIEIGCVPLEKFISRIRKCLEQIEVYFLKIIWVLKTWYDFYGGSKLLYNTDSISSLKIIVP